MQGRQQVSQPSPSNLSQGALPHSVGAGGRGTFISQVFLLPLYNCKMSSQNCRMSPFFLSFTYLARCNSRGALAFLTLSLQDQKTTLCSVWVICPCFHLFSTSCLGSVRSSLLIHTGLLPPELYFLLLRMNLYLGLSCRDKGKLPQKNSSVEVSQLKQI